jgi:DNA-binding MarR family transcriptional regulator
MDDVLEAHVAEKRESIVTEILSYTNREVSIIDAIVYYAEIHDVEIESLADLVNQVPSIKSRIIEDAEKLNLIEKADRLPI